MRLRHAVPVTATFVALALPAIASAHPRLVSSSPPQGTMLARGPTAVELEFSEDSHPVGDGIRVTDPSGASATVGSVEHDGRVLSRHVRATQRGTYVVEWQVVGNDTHPARGAFLFSVGQRTAAGLSRGWRTGTTLQATGRWLTLAGMVLGFGVPFAVLIALGAVMTRMLWRLVSIGVVLMIVAEPVSLIGQTATLAPNHPFDVGLAGDVLLTPYGHVAGLRLGVALGLWALAGAARAGAGNALWGIAALGAVASVVQAAAGHRIPGVPRGLSLALEATHVAAATIWIGAIVVAVAVTDVTSLLRRVAAPALAVLLLTGATLALGLLEPFSALVRSTYGATLLVKLTLVATAVVFGVAAARTQRARRLELAAGAAVLAAAGVLVSLLPPS